MTIKIRPLGDRVVVEPVEEGETKFAGGMLVLPDTAKEKPQQGTIVAVGPGARDEDGKRIAMEVKVGDLVIYAKYAGTTFKSRDGKEMLILRESDILGIVEE